MELETARPWGFQAGHLALDFANTMDWHASQSPVEHLNAFADLAAWAHDFGILSAEAADALTRGAGQFPEDAAAALAQAHLLREALYRVFAAAAQQGTPAPADLEIIQQVLAQAVAAGRLAAQGNKYHWTWPFRPGVYEQMLWPVAQAASDLLQSDQLSRVGQCADDRGCGLLFLDTSRNRSRQWCSMEDCGNRAKVQRHYQRAKKKSRG